MISIYYTLEVVGIFGYDVAYVFDVVKGLFGLKNGGLSEAEGGMTSLLKFNIPCLIAYELFGSESYYYLQCLTY